MDDVHELALSSAKQAQLLRKGSVSWEQFHRSSGGKPRALAEACREINGTYRQAYRQANDPCIAVPSAWGADPPSDALGYVRHYIRLRSKNTPVYGTLDE